MRGIAALSVVLVHLYQPVNEYLAILFPALISKIISFGFLGVPVFFVISGFVISLSIGNSKITPKYMGTFILRRSIRLDITYWASIAFAILLIIIKTYILNSDDHIPSASEILIHMFYLQELLELDPVISVVYWTLCLEVQLYIFYILTVLFSQIINRYLSFNTYLVHVFLILLVGVYSVLLEFHFFGISIPLKGLFVSNWHYFLLGVLVANVVRGLPFSSRILLLWLIFEIFIQIQVNIKWYTVAGIVSTIFIYLAWRNDKLNTFFTARVFLYLGKISYTLYLVHPDIGWKVIAFLKFLLNDYMSPMLAGVIYFIGIVASILCAHAFHLAFEKPSLWVVKKLKTISIKDIFYDVGNKVYRLGRPFLK